MNPQLQITVTPNVVTRMAPKAWLDAENKWLELPESLHRFAPRHLGDLEQNGALLRQEEHMGDQHNTPEILVKEWWDARSEFWTPEPSETKTIRQWLKNTLPHGKLNAVDFRHSLATLQIERLPSKKQLERALNTPLELTRYRGPLHGQLIPRRVRENGFITWRGVVTDGLRGSDVAPFLPVEGQPPDVLIAMIKWGWFNDPLKALEAMHALDIIPPPFPDRCMVTIKAPSGFEMSVIEQILGCSSGKTHTSRARKALYRARKIQLGGQPIEMNTSPSLPPLKDSNFFLPRNRQPTELFDRYHQGIQLDEEGRFSLTPERHALQIAERIPCETVYDAFSGCGGNTIAFARLDKHVIANELNPERLRMAKHNASIYTVGHLIDWKQQDALQQFPEAPFVFLDPPWGWGHVRLQEVLKIFQVHYATGQIKVPTSFPIPQNMTTRLYCTEEHFPSFLVLQWLHS